MSTLIIESTTTLSGVPPREVVRCRRCQLVQFRTTSDHCRRCECQLPASPKLELESNGALDKARVGADASDRHVGQSNLRSRTKTARELTIGRKLRELRDQRHLTQQDMAAKAGVPRTYISRIENARLLPGPVMLRRIADALHVEILDLLPRHKLGETQSSAPAMSPTEELFWNTLSGYFMQLDPEHMTMVLEHVRGIIGEVLPTSMLAAPAMAAR